MAETIQPICKACEQARANAKAAGHRGWANGACYDHAGTSFEALMARHTADDRSEIERLADAIVEASAP